MTAIPMTSTWAPSVRARTFGKGTASEPVKALQSFQRFFTATGGAGTSRRLLNVVSESAASIEIATTEPRARNFNRVIQHAQMVLGLTRKDLAKIFDVSRQTLYSRLKDDDTSTPHNAERYHAIDRVVTAIEQATTVALGASARTLIVDNTTLFAELCAESLDQDRIVHLAQIIDATLRDQSEKLTDVSEKQLKDNFSRLAPSA